MARSPTKTSVDWYDSEEVPSMAVPTGKKLAKTIRLYRRIALASFVALPLSLVVTMMMAIKLASRTPVVLPSVAPPGETVARVSLDEWLSSVPSPLPHAKVLYFDGDSVVTPPHVSLSSATKNRWTARDERFVVSTGRHQYVVTVEVGFPLGNTTGAVNATPEIAPLPAPSSNPASQNGPWPDVAANSSAPQPVAQAVQGWAQAYTSGSASALRLSVGDTNPQDHFTPLSGVASVTSSANWSLPLTSSGLMAVNVSLDIVWNGQQSQAQSQAPSPTTMDLLVERANTPAPVVVAWGPPGSGPTLTPYQNAK